MVWNRKIKELALESLKISGIIFDSKSLKWIATIPRTYAAESRNDEVGAIPRDSIESPINDEILWITSPCLSARTRNDDKATDYQRNFASLILRHLLSTGGVPLLMNLPS